jgi:putative ABC transport system permease protein
LQTGSKRPTFYTALWQTDLSEGLTVFVIAAGAEAAVTEATRTAIEADPLGRVLTARTIEETIAREMYPFRAAAWLMGVSGVSGLLLAALGLYGVMAHSVAQRTREFGIRATLGANNRDLARLVLKSGAQVAALAAVPGILLGLLVLRLATKFSGFAPSINALVIVAVLMFIAAVVMTACYVPAHRAGKIDPVKTLRAD